MLNMKYERLNVKINNKYERLAQYEWEVQVFVLMNFSQVLESLSGKKVKHPKFLVSRSID